MAAISEFRQKEVVNVHTGRRMGYICDIEVDDESGRILSVTVPSGRFFSSFMKSADTVIPWERITKIGKDIILVDIG